MRVCVYHGDVYVGKSLITHTVNICSLRRVICILQKRDGEKRRSSKFVDYFRDVGPDGPVVC